MESLRADLEKHRRLGSRARTRALRAERQPAALRETRGVGKLPDRLDCRAMLKVKGMRDAAPGKRLFVIEDEGQPASAELLDRIAQSLDGSSRKTTFPASSRSSAGACSL